MAAKSTRSPKEPKVVPEEEVVLTSPEEEEVILDDETTEEEVIVAEEPEKEEKPSIKKATVTVASMSPDSLPDKMVRVKIRSNHKCHIGGKMYVFERGATYTVSEDVRRILGQADKLLPLN